MNEPKTYTLEVPGAVLHYDVREGGGAGHPVLLLAGAPMGASGFAALAEQFADCPAGGIWRCSSRCCPGRPPRSG